MIDSGLADRTRRLLEEAKYLTLATVSADGLPWSAVLQYAWFADPLRLVFGSPVQARHSRHISVRPEVSGTLFVAGTASEDDLTAVDGAQFTGRCSALAGDDLDRLRIPFYEAVLPDPQVRAEWMLPRSALLPPADHRLYGIDIQRWWLVDTSTWAEDRIDRRIEMPLTDLAAP